MRELTDDRLLPCPFCGTVPKLVKSTFGYQSMHNGEPNFKVECRDMDCFGPATPLYVGEVQWHCSEDSGPPDVGVLLRLDASQYLWAGEILRSDWEDAGPDAAALGDDFGWWAILYEEGGGKKTVLGRFIDPYTAQEFIEKLAWIVKSANSFNPPAPKVTTGEAEERG